LLDATRAAPDAGVTELARVSAPIQVRGRA
jgi:hypothetical protein